MDSCRYSQCEYMPHDDAKLVHACQERCDWPASRDTLAPGASTMHVASVLASHSADASRPVSVSRAGRVAPLPRTMGSIRTGLCQHELQTKVAR